MLLAYLVVSSYDRSSNTLSRETSIPIYNVFSHSSDASCWQFWKHIQLSSYSQGKEVDICIEWCRWFKGNTHFSSYIFCPIYSLIREEKLTSHFYVLWPWLCSELHKYDCFTISVACFLHNRRAQLKNNSAFLDCPSVMGYVIYHVAFHL